MKEITLSALPPCFEKWCAKFDNLFQYKGQKNGFRYYIAGLLGESKRKNIAQMNDNIVDSTYHKIHHFIAKSSWNADDVNERRLEIINKRNQTRIRNGFTLIIDDSGHVKSGNFTDGVGRQYIGEIGKTENGIVTMTTHLDDGVRSIPLDLALYQHADSLPEGKENKDFIKKPDLALNLIKKTIQRKFYPGIVLMDGSYGNNSNFLRELEKLKLDYLGALAKNRQVKVINKQTGEPEASRKLDELTLSLNKEDFNEVIIELNKPKQVWVTTIEGKIKTVTIKRNPLGELFIFVVTDFVDNQVSTMTGNSAGFDFGCKVFLTCSDNTEIKSPLFLKQSLKELKLASRNQSRKKRRSNNREKARKHLVRVHEKVVNRRQDWFWKLAHKLTDKFDYLFFETLNLKGMQRLWGRKISDLAFAEFLKILDFVATKKGKVVSYINRWTPSSKTCSECDYVLDKLGLNERYLVCPSCSTKHGRDSNASRVIQKLGLQPWG